MSLDTVKKLTGDNPQVEVIHDMITQRLRILLDGIKDVEQGLTDLEYIIDEVTIVRFNRIGSEGMKAETVEGHKVEFNFNDPFNAYEDIIQRYIDEHSDIEAEKRVVRFL